MKPTVRFVALALALAALFAASTDDGNGGEPTGPGTGGTGNTMGGVGPTPVTTGPAARGTYEYVNAGLRVIVEIDGTEGTMEVENGTERELPDPDFYILDARDGTEIEGEVAEPAPTRAGETATFAISFEGIEVRNIGLLVLIFGTDNYGAFVRTA
ncbi:MAG: hypothetical protein ACRDHC_03535 [Actinomycetota bacterium]